MKFAPRKKFWRRHQSQIIKTIHNIHVLVDQAMVCQQPETRMFLRHAITEYDLSVDDQQVKKSF